MASIDASTSGAGGIITTADNTGTLNLQSGGSTIATVSSTGLSLATGKTLSVGGVTGSPFSLKNRIINGDMVISQRNGTSSVNVSGTTYVYQTADRFYMGGLNGVTTPFTIQQVSDAPTGFVNSVKLTTNTTDALGTAATEYEFQQTIEANNVSDFNLGTANAVTVTLSFWVKSSLTGLFGLGIRNAPTFNRSYVATYTISAANTWEKKTVTLTMDTTGTWATSGNGSALNIAWSLGVGSNGRGTAGVWQTGGQVQTSGCVNVVSNAAATWQITGVQLEQGSSATSYEWLPYTTELQLCQRYYWQRNSESSYAGVAAGGMNGASQARFVLPYPVPMRSAATVSITNIGNLIVNQGASDLIASGLTAYANSTTAMIDLSTTTSGTLGRGATLIYNISSSSSIQASAEL
jgi:hypothetical protein